MDIFSTDRRFFEFPGKSREEIQLIGNKLTYKIYQNVGLGAARPASGSTDQFVRRGSDLASSSFLWI